MLHNSKSSRVMETGDHFKNGASSKSQKSRGNFLRKVVLFIVVATLTVNNSIAQLIWESDRGIGFRIVYGIQAGLNLSNVRGSDAEDTKIMPGFQIGIMNEMYDQRIRNLSIQSGLLFSQLGHKGEEYQFLEYELRDDMTVNYLQVPINIRYNFNLGSDVKLFIQAGPYFGFAISGKQKTVIDGESVSTKINFSDLDMRRFDYGLGFGGGVKVIENIQIGFKYDLGFDSLDKGKEPDQIYNSNLAFTVTYMFGR